MKNKRFVLFPLILILLISCTNKQEQQFTYKKITTYPDKIEIGRNSGNYLFATDIVHNTQIIYVCEDEHDYSSEHLLNRIYEIKKGYKKGRADFVDIVELGKEKTYKHSKTFNANYEMWLDVYYTNYRDVYEDFNPDFDKTKDNFLYQKIGDYTGNLEIGKNSKNQVLATDMDNKIQVIFVCEYLEDYSVSQLLKKIKYADTVWREQAPEVVERWFSRIATPWPSESFKHEKAYDAHFNIELDKYYVNYRDVYGYFNE